MTFRTFTAIFFSFLISIAAAAGEIVLNPSHPDRYTVVKGDTLWDIAGRFLQAPWDWPKIWKRNPNIRNPDLIYPGDVIVLTYDASGRPWLSFESDYNPSSTRLSPQIRSRPIEEAIPTIPINAIKQFLTQARVVSKQEIDNAPYIVSFAEERLLGGAGDTIYVRAIDSNNIDRYTVFRPGDALKDPDTDEILGYQTLFVADTLLQRTGDPATLQLRKTAMQAIVGDRLLPVPEERIPLSYHPRAPEQMITGHIIGVLDGVTQIGQFSVVTIDRGRSEGLEPGHVLAIYQTGPKIRDIVSKHPSDVTLPNEKAGMLMVFRSFDRVSYALVVHATMPMHTLDSVQTPY
jgi:LysM repeat protein